MLEEEGVQAKVLDVFPRQERDVCVVRTHSQSWSARETSARKVFGGNGGIGQILQDA